MTQLQIQMQISVLQAASEGENGAQLPEDSDEGPTTVRCVLSLRINSNGTTIPKSPREKRAILNNKLEAITERETMINSLHNIAPNDNLSIWENIPARLLFRLSRWKFHNEKKTFDDVCLKRLYYCLLCFSTVHFVDLGVCKGKGGTVDSKLVGVPFMECNAYWIIIVD